MVTVKTQYVYFPPEDGSNTSKDAVEGENNIYFITVVFKITLLNFILFYHSDTTG